MGIIRSFALAIVILAVVSGCNSMASIGVQNTTSLNQPQTLNFFKLLPPPQLPPTASLEVIDVKGNIVVSENGKQYGYHWLINGNFKTVEMPKPIVWPDPISVPLNSTGVVKIESAVLPGAAQVLMFTHLQPNGMPAGNPEYACSTVQRGNNSECTLERESSDPNVTEIKFPIRLNSNNLYITIWSAWSTPHSKASLESQVEFMYVVHPEVSKK